jgi:hypothetical protein
MVGFDGQKRNTKPYRNPVFFRAGDTGSGARCAFASSNAQRLRELKEPLVVRSGRLAGYAVQGSQGAQNEPIEGIEEHSIGLSVVAQSSLQKEPNEGTRRKQERSRLPAQGCVMQAVQNEANAILVVRNNSIANQLRHAEDGRSRFVDRLLAADHDDRGRDDHGHQ